MKGNNTRQTSKLQHSFNLKKVSLKGRGSWIGSTSFFLLLVLLVVHLYLGVVLATPTRKPTPRPSVQPTPRPSVEPTPIPSAVPTVQPTLPTSSISAKTAFMFNSSMGYQKYITPAGVTKLFVKTWGGKGGSSYLAYAGGGGIYIYICLKIQCCFCLSYFCIRPFSPTCTSFFSSFRF